jgi:hypothetical protein
MSGAFWKDQELDILKEMVEAGRSLQEIMSVLKSRTAEGIRNQMDSKGLSFSREPEIDMEAFKKIMKGGK